MSATEYYAFIALFNLGVAIHAPDGWMRNLNFLVAFAAFLVVIISYNVG